MTRSNDERAGGCSAYPSKTHENQHAHFASDDGDSKAFLNMQARAAMAGCTLHELSDGYLIGRWNLCRSVPDLRAVGDMLRQIGGSR